MKLICTLTICCLTLRVDSQVYFEGDQNLAYAQNRNRPLLQNVSPMQNNILKPAYNRNIEKVLVTDYDSYLQAISRNQNGPNQQVPNRNQAISADEQIHFDTPSLELSPPFGPNTSPNYYALQQNNAANPLSTSAALEVPVSNLPAPQINVFEQQTQVDNSRLNNVTIAISGFGLNLMKTISQLQSGNIIMSPTSIATALALLQQGATGQSQEQITRTLQMSPEASESAFGAIAANMRKRNSRNILTIANNLVVAESFELNPAFKYLAIQSFGSEITPSSFLRPLDTVQKINAWVASKTNDKITNVLVPGSISSASQLVLVNAVYFKGLWETKFKVEMTQPDEFQLSNGVKKSVQFMHIKHSFKTGYDLNTRALVTILPFESHQYSLMLILPKKKDNVANVLATLTPEQLLNYQKFDKVEIKVELPRFTIKSNTNLNPALKNMGITNIFGLNSDLSGIGLYRNTSPQISNAVHSGYLSVDEQGVTAAASTAFAAVALSYDDSSTTFRADRPFIAVLWDSQFSIPLFVAKIEDPS